MDFNLIDMSLPVAAAAAPASAFFVSVVYFGSFSPAQNREKRNNLSIEKKCDEYYTYFLSFFFFVLAFLGTQSITPKNIMITRDEEEANDEQFARILVIQCYLMFGIVVAFVGYTCHTLPLRAKYQIIMDARCDVQSFVHRSLLSISLLFCIFVVRVSFSRCQIAVIECNEMIASDGRRRVYYIY